MEKKLPVGKAHVEWSDRDNISKKKAVRTQDVEITAGLEPYQALADQSQLSLGTVMRSLPRGSMSVKNTVSKSGSYSSLSVGISLDVVFPTYDPEEYLQMFSKVYDCVTDVLAETLDTIKQDKGYEDFD